MRKIVISEDGSSTIYQSDIDEHYHSIKGAIQESQHIFIQAALKYWIGILKNKEVKELNILEIGFGTGLNALLVILEDLDIKINYYTFEAYPLEQEIIDTLKYHNNSSVDSLFKRLHEVEWNEIKVISDYFSIFKINKDFSLFISDQFNELFDIVFFDAFSPDKQPRMWTTDIFSKIYQWMREDGILTTYCAKGNVRRSMQEVGFSVERIPGPPGKREILRASK